MSMQDSFEENDGMLNAMGHMAAISQRNQQIAQQKEHAEAIRKQTAELEKANRIEADRAQIERQRLAIEQQRLQADELEREMRKQQAEQVRQLRNLMVDSMDTLESVKKSLAVQLVNEASKETALRKTAALQAQLKILESQSDILTDMSDMKELRLFRSSLSEFIAEQSANGNLPDNPLVIIKDRLESLKVFFIQSDAELNMLSGWKADWLNQFPKVSLGELQHAKTELAELKNQLPSTQERQRNMLNLLDWDIIGRSIDLHQELRICAELMPRQEIKDRGESTGGIILPGRKKSYRQYLPQSGSCADKYEFAHSAGASHAQVIGHLGKVDKRIDELICLHDKHQELLAEAEAHLANENFRSAERVIKIYDKQRFPDIDYTWVESEIKRQFDLFVRLSDIQSLLSGLTTFEMLAVGRELEKIGDVINKDDSLLGQIFLSTQKAHRLNFPLVLANWPSGSSRHIVVNFLALFSSLAKRDLARERELKAFAIQQAAEAKAKLSAEIGAGRVGVAIGVPLAGKMIIPFAFCPAGSFTMGSPSAEDGRSDDEKQVKVTLTKGFWMAKTELTQAQWTAIMGNNPSNLNGDDLPVKNVSWDDAQAFIKKVNDSGVIPEGWKVALPTEAQWEYACRAGETGAYSGRTIDQVAWYDDNSGSKTHAVGTKKSNAWGLHDMHGNVWEWCEDWYGNELPGGTDPLGPSSGVTRVARGGSWNYHAAYCRAAYRSRRNPGHRFYDLGFRPALVPSE
jgi:formylglycine-generating enzyme required for sulfatase activity